VYSSHRQKEVATLNKGVDMQFSKSLMVWGLMGCLAMAQAQTTLTSPLVEGQCSNGAPYKLQTYRENHQGQQVSGYAYEGPVGQGTVLSSVPLDQARRYVCKEAGIGRWLPDDGDDQ
jgi:hypothetical protein